MSVVVAWFLVGCGAASPPKTADSSPPPDDSAGGDDSRHTGDSRPVDTVDLHDSSHTGDSVPDSASVDTDTAPPPPPTAADCFGWQWGDGSVPVPDYDAIGAVLGSHCMGTNHQDIADIGHVAFVGDSVTVGTPPNDVDTFYRNALTDWLVDRYGLAPPDDTWRQADWFEGTAGSMHSGDFSSCAKWGARTDDLMEDNDQISDCIPEEVAGETTLLVTTVGGNDLFSIVEDYYAGMPIEEVWAETVATTDRLREALEWLTTDTSRFPGKVYVVTANVYEFTDGLGNVDACPTADVAGYHYDLSAPELQDMKVYLEEETLRIAVKTGTDMIFLDEAFCGHGFNADEPEGRCYRGVDTDTWFDISCFHPDDDGHRAITELFEAVIAE